MKLLRIVLLGMMVSACGHTIIEVKDRTLYYAPSSDLPEDQKATIAGKETDSGIFFADICVTISEIDGRWIQDIEKDKCANAYDIAPGPHTVQAMLFAEEYPRGKAKLSFNALPGHNYHLAFDLPPLKIPHLPDNVWIEDTTSSKRVSDITLLDRTTFGPMKSRVSETTEADLKTCFNVPIGQEEKSIQACQRLIEAEPAGTLAPPAHIGKGIIFVNLGQYRKAIAEFDRALAIQPDNVHAYLELCGVKRRQQEQLPLEKQDYSSALADCEKALDLAPDDFLAIDRIATLYSSMGELDKAETYIRRDIKTAPDWARPHYVLGIIHMRGGNYDEARREFATARQNTSDPEMSVLAPLVQLCTGETKDAEHAYDDILDKHPRMASALWGRSIARSRTGDKEGAMADASEALSLNSTVDLYFYRVCAGMTPKPDLPKKSDR